MHRALIETPLHPVLVTVNNEGLSGLSFQNEEDYSRLKRINKLQPKPSQMELIHLEETRDWLEKYFSNQPTKLPTLDLKELTDFTQKILFGLIDTKSGQTITYGRLGHQSGFPNAARAVGSAMATNPITIIIPCHRVVQSDGSLGNYSGHGGPKSKQWLLDHESN